MEEAHLPGGPQGWLGEIWCPITHPLPGEGEELEASLPADLRVFRTGLGEREREMRAGGEK